MGDGVMRVNTALETTALPPFRVMGLTAPVRFRHEAEDVAAAWQRWLSGSLKDALPAFAPSVYALRHSYHDAGYTLMIGHLVSNDAPLPAGAGEWMVPPQVYRVATLPEASRHAAAEAWQRLAALPERRFAVDFESHPSWGASKVYVGVAGEVAMAEEGLDD
ncbi:GyrI-like domain-containing protein [Kingella oralis]|uniref:GyrI-like domain-containing protein n=1 Tax=Kingella oralis TaxID=505 RepID=UPI002D80ED52|nr:effector binding domain-containing protein [Kingella oralis]